MRFDRSRRAVFLLSGVEIAYWTNANAHRLNINDLAAKRKITVAYGDGIGPEIMQATLDILFAAGANIETEVIEIGEKVYKKGISTGITQDVWDSLNSTKVFLKAPITTPQGGGFKSLNVNMRFDQ